MGIYIDHELDQDILTDDLVALVKKSIVTTLDHEAFDKDYDVSVTFVDKDRIRALNRDYRNKDAVTDVLSFVQYTEEGFEVFEGEPLELGDVVICYDVALEQARDYGHTTEREVAYLVCHSTLHLLGYDHMTDEDKKAMRQEEKAIMKKMGLERIVDTNV